MWKFQEVLNQDIAILLVMAFGALSVVRSFIFKKVGAVVVTGGGTRGGNGSVVALLAAVPRARHAHACPAKSCVVAEGRGPLYSQILGRSRLPSADSPLTAPPTL